MTDHLKRNANLIDALGSALREGDHAIGTVPGLVKRVLLEESWREFVTQRGDHVRHERFADFVTQPPLRGLGGSVDVIERIVEGDEEAVRLLRNALKVKPGPKSGDVMTRTGTMPAGRKRMTPTGTSRAYALQRLEKDRPELHAEVIAGRLSAHAAMVQAGFHPETFTVRADSAEKIVATLRRKLPAETLAEVAALLG